ncbi:hypothetical protein KJS94_02765 [Flavihumibacter rivuli]|uniref:hypothetical protein n=1 Tax=Flavihumibacter rivuli TaxID=2838156 RepID=UPI001BDF39E9|nr:hypothetical protein [Flavihumibacter rivuli]ULQ57118.1 hypothetical protein KJS94_02765 [Flavihumibacter rivuli]
MWNYIEPWIDRRQYALVTFSVLVGSWLLYSSITSRKVSSLADLTTVEGQLSRYSFIDGKKGTKRYYIWLTQYNASFQIPADFISYFDKDHFKEAVGPGQTISISISKDDINKTRHSNYRIRIYSLQTESQSFLLSSFTLKKENNIIQYMIGPLFIMAGIGYYLYRHKKMGNVYR